MCVFFHWHYLSRRPVFFIANLEASKLETSPRWFRTPLGHFMCLGSDQWWETASPSGLCSLSWHHHQGRPGRSSRADCSGLPLPALGHVPWPSPRGSDTGLQKVDQAAAGTQLALHDPRAGHGEPRAAKATAGTLSCSRGCLPNLGYVTVERGWDGVNIRADARHLGATRDTEKPRNRIWASLAFKIIGVGAGGSEVSSNSPEASHRG